VPGGFLLLDHVSARFEKYRRNKPQFTAPQGVTLMAPFRRNARTDYFMGYDGQPHFCQ
jgi:hypothetical protein